MNTSSPNVFSSNSLIHDGVIKNILEFIAPFIKSSGCLIHCFKPANLSRYNKVPSIKFVPFAISQLPKTCKPRLLLSHGCFESYIAIATDKFFSILDHRVVVWVKYECKLV